MTFIQNLIVATLTGSFALAGALLVYLNERSTERERMAAQCREEVEFINDNPSLSNLSYEFFSCFPSRAVYLEAQLNGPESNVIDEVAANARSLAVSRRDQVIGRLSDCSDIKCETFLLEIRNLADGRKALLHELQSVGLQLQVMEPSRDQKAIRLKDNIFVCGARCAELDEEINVLHSQRRAIESELRRISDNLADAVVAAEKRLN